MNIFCDECKKNIATVFLTKVSATEVSKVQLCEECAKRMEETTEAANLLAFLPHILAGLQGVDEDVVEEVLPGELSVCDICGTSYNDFSKMGYLGCADCYQAFAEPLGMVIAEFQGSEEHRGKVPGNASEGALLRRRLVELERNLARQISQEQYEAAAAVRDQIREIQGRIEGASSNGR
ncbi:MAG: UvrB/UvrC motif-containing protein [Actinobacteria bacterium]|nr:UvrB/UvrC motif-containing protein [Actinomycetota bacterium]MBU1942125.1 UvrB/UvrC motif-containing protein [Actinomycetota bacterium]MBU2686691.1 UvrB/UvrC motif-containing protein [Actinomycetota bacterium]